MRIRLPAVVALVLVAACGSSKTAAPATTGASAASTTAAPSTSAAPTTAAPTTAVPTTTTTTEAPTTTLAPAPTGYAAAQLPKFADATVVPGAAGAMADGLYYGLMVSADAAGPSIAVEFHQFLSGTAGQQAATRDSVDFTNDYYVPQDPNSTRTIDLPVSTVVTVADVGNPGSSYAVGGAELVRLWNEVKQSGSATAGKGAPTGFSFAPFGIYMTVKGGVVTRVDQLWTP